MLAGKQDKKFHEEVELSPFKAQTWLNEQLKALKLHASIHTSSSRPWINCTAG